MLRATAWCILVIFKFASVLNRLTYSLLIKILNFANDILQGYLSRIDGVSTEIKHRKFGDKIIQPSKTTESKEDYVQSSDFKLHSRGHQNSKEIALEKTEAYWCSSMSAEISEITARGVYIRVPDAALFELSRASKVVLSYEFNTHNSRGDSASSHVISNRIYDNSIKHLSPSDGPTVSSALLSVGRAQLPEQCLEGHVVPAAHPSENLVVPSAHPSEGLVEPAAHPSEGLVKPAVLPSHELVGPAAHPSELLVVSDAHPSEKRVESPAQYLRGRVDIPVQYLERLLDTSAEYLELIFGIPEHYLEGSADSPARSSEGHSESPARSSEGHSESPARSSEGRSESLVQCSERCIESLVQSPEGRGETSTQYSEERNESPAKYVERRVELTAQYLERFLSTSAQYLELFVEIPVQNLEGVVVFPAQSSEGLVVLPVQSSKVRADSPAQSSKPINPSVSPSIESEKLTALSSDPLKQSFQSPGGTKKLSLQTSGGPESQTEPPLHKIEKHSVQSTVGETEVIDGNQKYSKTEDKDKKSESPIEVSMSKSKKNRRKKKRQNIVKIIVTMKKNNLI